MGTITDMIIKIGADSSQLNKGLGEAKSAIDRTFDTSPVESMTHALSGTTAGIEGLITKFGGLAAMVAGGFGLVSVIENAAKAGDNIHDMAEKLHISVAEAGRLNRIMSLTGGDAGTLTTAMMRLDKSFSAVGDSGDTCRAMLEAVGVSLTDSDGKLLTVDKQLQELAKGYKAATEAGYGQEFIMNTLGARGMALVDTLQEYNQAAEYASKVKGIGLDAEAMDELNMQIQVLKMEGSQVGLAFTQALLPIVQDILPALMEGLQSTATFLAENKRELADITTAAAEFYAMYKGIQFLQSAGNKINSIFGGMGIAAQQAQIVELEKYQVQAINRRVRMIEQAAAKEIALEAKKVQQMAISEEEKTRLVTEFTAKRTILAQQAAAKERAAMAETFLAYNAGQTEMLAATERTTAAQNALTVATARTGAAAEGAAAATVTASAGAGKAVQALTQTVWALVGGWLGVAAAIGYAFAKLLQYKAAEAQKVQDSYITLSSGETVRRGEGGDWEAVGDVGADQMARLLNDPEAEGYLDDHPVEKKGLSAEDIAEANQLEYERTDEYKKEIEKAQAQDAQDDAEARIKEALAGIGGGSEVKGGSSGGGGTDTALKAARAEELAGRMMNQMKSAILDQNGTAYQLALEKNKQDIEDKQRRLASLTELGASEETIEKLKKTFDEYQTAINEKVIKKHNEAISLFAKETAYAYAESKHNYIEMAEAQYEATKEKLDREREDKEKELMRDEDDWETRQMIADSYYAKLQKAEEDMIHAKRQAHQEYIRYLQEEGDYEAIIANGKSNGDDWRADSELNGRRKLAAAYTEYIQEQHRTWTDYLASASGELYGSMTDNLTDFIKGTKSAKDAIADFGNTILNTIARIAAQRLASQWISGLLGAFGGGASSGTDEAWGMGFETALADGGIVTRPTVALIGEGGTDEAVIPLNNDNLAAIGNSRGGGGGVVVNITNNTNDNVNAQNSRYDADMGQYVLDIVIDGATRNRSNFGSNLKDALERR